MNKKLKWALIGLAIFVVVIIIPVICISISIIPTIGTLFGYKFIKNKLINSSIQTETTAIEVPKSEESEIETTEIEAKEKYFALGQSVEHKGLKVNITDYKFTDSYEQKSSDKHKAPEGSKYLWVYIKAENVGESKLTLPPETNFYISYKGNTIDVESIIYLKDIIDPIVGGPFYMHDEVYPGYGKEGWLIYEIYEKAELSDIKIQWIADYETEYYWSLPY